MSTPLIAPPPAPPKKRTVNARLEEAIFENLKRYIVYAGGGDFSHFINQGLKMVFEKDEHFGPWVAAHPGTVTETRKKKPQPKLQPSPKASPARDASSEASRNIARVESGAITGGARADVAS